MTKVSVPGFICVQKARDWQTPLTGQLAGMQVTWSTCDTSILADALLVIPQAQQFDLPDDWDPRPVQIAALQKKQAACALLMTEISTQINKLQALEATPTAIDALQTEAVAS